MSAQISNQGQTIDFLARSEHCQFEVCREEPQRCIGAKEPVNWFQPTVERQRHGILGKQLRVPKSDGSKASRHGQILDALAGVKAIVVVITANPSHCLRPRKCIREEYDEQQASWPEHSTEFEQRLRVRGDMLQHTKTDDAIE